MLDEALLRRFDLAITLELRPTTDTAIDPVGTKRGKICI